MSQNILKIALIIGAIFIWGNNAYRFFTGIKAADEPDVLNLPAIAVNSISTLQIKTQNMNWTYGVNQRDPFRNWLTAKSRAKPKHPPRPKPVKQKQRPPRLKLTGVISDPNGALAIIEDAKQIIHFAAPGDTVAGVFIKTVSTTEVVCLFEKEIFKLRLN